MLQQCASALVCPLCGASFEVEGRSVVCHNRHTFDLARSGYVNLLPSTRKLAETVGDNQEMLSARKRFLDGGYFDPLVDALRRSARESTEGPVEPEGYVVEVGSGTGHYLAAIKDALAGTPAEELCFFGIDISKAAARMSAGLHKDITFLVADVHKGIPLDSGNAHLLLDVFAPRSPQEFARVLHPNGRVVVVIPGSDHLGELVSRFDLLQVHGDKEEIMLKDFEGTLRLTDRTPIQYDVSLPAQAVQDVVEMGPSARHLSDETRLAIDETTALTCTASFVVLTFERL